MVVKHKNDELFVMPLKYVLSVVDLANQSGTLELSAIAHEDSPKMPCKSPRTPKLWT
jgi:hypothetical protein